MKLADLTRLTSPIFGRRNRVELVKIRGSAAATPVDAYWGQHTVNSKPFVSAVESEQYLEWRFDQYPLFREFMDLWGEHDGQTILDYGCGPGNDVTGFLLYTKAARVIGIDVSRKALELARRRLDLHGIDTSRVTLLHSSDALDLIPLDSDAVDYVNCGGVLHHTSRPDLILSELHRVLKPGGHGRMYVYNRESLWFHLYTAYVKMVVEGHFAGMSVPEAFALNTDGEQCPIARCYTAAEFGALCESAGFEWQYLGGYLSRVELDHYRRYGEEAERSSELASEHRQFLAALDSDERGLPRYRGKHAGIGGSYIVSKPK